jgi:CheY-like chemotaxis protein
VVIIEDEPLIALDLERLVTDLGHRVVKIARTASGSDRGGHAARPGLILADIQLADGSSGLDAVNEILRSFSRAGDPSSPPTRSACSPARGRSRPS